MTARCASRSANSRAPVLQTCRCERQRRAARQALLPPAGACGRSAAWPGPSGYPCAGSDRRAGTRPARGCVGILRPSDIRRSTRGVLRGLDSGRCAFCDCPPLDGVSLSCQGGEPPLGAAVCRRARSRWVRPVLGIGVPRGPVDRPREGVRLGGGIRGGGPPLRNGCGAAF